VNDAVWADGRWVVVGQQGETAVSDDGVSWSVAVPALFDSFDWRPAATNGSAIVAAAGTTLYRSVDGIAWQRDASSSAPPVSLLQAFKGGFVGRTPDGFASSPDGVAWTRHLLAPPDPPIYEEITGMACSPARCVAVGSEVLTSDDAVEWSRSALPAGRQLFDIAWTGSRFVAIGLPESGSDAMVLESTDGLVWTGRTQLGLAAPSMLAANGTRVVAIGGKQGHIYTATGWLVFADLVLPSNDDLRTLVWTGTYFAALGRKPDMDHPALWVSGDGTTWREVAVPAVYGLRGIFGVGPRLSLFGDRGTILTTSCTDYAMGRAPRRQLQPHR
jgi:hypothetical protein